MNTKLRSASTWIRITLTLPLLFGLLLATVAAQKTDNTVGVIEANERRAEPAPQKTKPRSTPTPKVNASDVKPATNEDDDNPDKDDAEVNAARRLVKRDVHVYITVLAPKNVADIFGTRISKRYLAVQITIRNENKDFQLLVGNVSLDMRKVVNVTQHPELANYQFPGTYKPSSNDLSLVRGVAEKGQDYDKRNLIFRTLRGAGSVAAGLISFISFGPSYAPGIATFNGPLIEAYKDVFPDQTVNQLIRLNDSAYSVNTLVPKQSSKVMVAFLDLAMLMDKKHRDQFRSDPLSIVDEMDFRKISGIVYGSFIAEITEQPLRITDVIVKPEELDHFKDDHPVVKGFVIGRNLNDATINIESGPKGATAEIDGTPEADRLDFIIKANAPIDTGQAIKLKVAKGSDVQHGSLEVRYAIGNPILQKVDPLQGNQGQSLDVTLTGTNFIKGLSVVKISPDTGIDITVNEVTSTSIKATLVIASDADIAVPRKIHVENGDGFSSGTKTINIKKKPS